MLLQVGIERHPRDHLDDAATDVGGHAVVPARTGIEQQRDARQELHRLGQADVGSGEVAEIVVAIDGVDRVGEHEPVGQPRHVRQDVVHGDGPGRGPHLGCILAATRPHLHVAELGDPTIDPVLEQDLTPFVELHQRDRGDRLAHRVDAEDRVVGQGLSGGDVGGAVRVPVDHRPRAGDLDVGARQPARVDVASAAAPTRARRSVLIPTSSASILAPSPYRPSVVHLGH